MAGTSTTLASHVSSRCPFWGVVAEFGYDDARRATEILYFRLEPFLVDLV